MQLSPHFSLDEFTRSDAAQRHHLDNTPPPEVINSLKRLAEAMEEVRTLLKGPIYVNSAYRSPEVNLLVGSKPTSDHLHGLAIDFVCPSFGSPDQIVRAIMASPIPFKQVIREFDSWVHFAIPKEGEKAKREALIIDKTGTRIYK